MIKYVILLGLCFSAGARADQFAEDFKRTTGFSEGEYTLRRGSNPACDEGSFRIFGRGGKRVSLVLGARTLVVIDGQSTRDGDVCFSSQYGEGYAWVEMQRECRGPARHVEVRVTADGLTYETSDRAGQPLRCVLRRSAN